MFDNAVTRIAVQIVIGGIVVSIVLAILPVYPFPDNFANALNYFFGLLWQFDFVLPVELMLNVFALIISVEILLFMVDFVFFVKNLFTKRV